MGATNVDPEYVLGWKCDYFRLPEREEQRVTNALQQVMKTAQKRMLATLISGEHRDTRV